MPNHAPVRFLVAFLVLLLWLPTALATDSDIVILLDNSGSMRHHDPSFLLRQAVLSFTDQLDPNTHVSILSFDGNVVSLLPFITLGGAHTEVQQALRRINYRGPHTDIASAVERATYLLQHNSRPRAQKSILLFTDGYMDTGNINVDQQKMHWLIRELATACEEDTIRIFGIAFTEEADYQLLQSLAWHTHGDYFRVLNPDEIETAFHGIQALIAPPLVPIATVRAIAAASVVAANTPVSVNTPSSTPVSEPSARLEASAKLPVVQHAVPAANDPEPTVAPTDTALVSIAPISVVAAQETPRLPVAPSMGTQATHTDTVAPASVSVISSIPPHNAPEVQAVHPVVVTPPVPPHNATEVQAVHPVVVTPPVSPKTAEGQTEGAYENGLDEPAENHLAVWIFVLLVAATLVWDTRKKWQKTVRSLLARVRHNVQEYFAILFEKTHLLSFSMGSASVNPPINKSVMLHPKEREAVLHKTIQMYLDAKAERKNPPRIDEETYSESIPVTDEKAKENSGHQTFSERLPAGITAKLIDMRGEDGVGEFTLTHTRTAIGRHVEGKPVAHYLYINDPTVSRRHAVIEFRDSSFWIQDAKSVNGTYVNRQRIYDEVLLKNNDFVQFHLFAFHFVISSGEPAFVPVAGQDPLEETH